MICMFIGMGLPKRQFKLWRNDGVLIECEGVNSTSRVLGLSNKGLKPLLYGKVKSAGGHALRYWNCGRPDLSGLAGVYSIENTVTGRRYYGASSDLRERYLGHRATLRRGSGCSSGLQSDWDRYGEDAFRFDVLYSCPDGAGIADLEVMCILHQGAGESSYNVQIMGNSFCDRNDMIWVFPVDGEPFMASVQDTLWSSGKYRDRNRYHPEGYAHKLSSVNMSRLKHFRLTDGHSVVDCSGVRQTADRLGLNRKALIRVVNGRQRAHKGWSLAK